MAKIIGYDQNMIKKFTCRECGAIVEYVPLEDKKQYNSFGNPLTDEGTHITGLNCPGCHTFHRTNP